MKKSVFLTAVCSLVLAACSSNPPEPYDYSAFLESRPKSILVTLPKNNTPDVNAATSVLAQAAVPLAEKGYYVFPVALVNEIFQQNGLTNGHDIQTANIKKIREIFGADAVMYLDVEEYGTSYKVFDSVTTVAVNAKLVDLRSGQTLWTGTAKQSVSSTDQKSSGVVALLVAAVSQIINTIKDQGYAVSGQVNTQLFTAGSRDSILYGPYHAQYGKDPQLHSGK